MWEYNYTNEMYHWGISGMHWGVRRFQNPDGTLTEEGKARYGVNSTYLTKNDINAKEAQIERQNAMEVLKKDNQLLTEQLTNERLTSEINAIRTQRIREETEALTRRMEAVQYSKVAEETAKREKQKNAAKKFIAGLGLLTIISIGRHRYKNNFVRSASNVRALR